MNDHEIILAIQDLMDGTAWDSSTMNDICQLLVNNGYAIHDLDGRIYEESE
jgi:hypothetical protein